MINKKPILILVSLLLIVFLVRDISAQIDLSNYELDMEEDFSKDMPDNVLMLDNSQWDVSSNRLEATDFSNSKSGALVFIFDNKTYSAKEPYIFSAVVDRNDYKYGVDFVGLIVGYNGSDKKNEVYSRSVKETEITYYSFATSDMQGYFTKRGEGWTGGGSIRPDVSGINLTQKHKLQINIKENSVELYINDKLVGSKDITIPDGKIGFFVWDCSGSNDPEFDGRSYFDDVKVYKSPTLTVIEPNETTLL